MKTKNRKIQRAALTLAVVSLAAALFPVKQRSIKSQQSESVNVLSATDEVRWSQPLSFEANRGQADDDVKFVGRGKGFGLLLKQSEAVLALRNRTDEVTRSHKLSMKFEGASPAALIAGVDKQKALASYFIGNDPAKWIRDIETYSRVTYSGLYPDIDLTFYEDERELEFDFEVAPGADPQRIALRFQGADRIRLGSQGSLILHTAAGDVRYKHPVAYQETDGSKLEVPARFKILSDDAIGFEVAAYDSTRPLIIDPVLVYSSYVGGNAADAAIGIVADSTGNTILVGDSFSTDFLSPRAAGRTDSDIFVGRLSSNGLLLRYSFFGGTKNEFATGMSVDGMGNIYVSGVTQSPDFPVFHSFAQVLMGSSDAFVIKLTPGADQFFYLSLIGGSGDEAGVSVAADSTGSAYITGRTTSADFPVVSAIQSSYGGGSSDAFVSKLTSDGSGLVYSTFLGGSGAEDSAGKTGISVDSTGNVYVTGDTSSGNFPTKNALRSSKSGAASSFDGFVAKINPAGSDFVYSTYLGGSDNDVALAIAIDSTGNAYVTGSTNSTSFTGSSATRPAASAPDAFVAKINASGSAISYLTFLGGSGFDSADAIAVDASGNAVIAGSAGADLPTVNSIQSFRRGGDIDAFVAKVGTTGTVSFSTYIGGSGDDQATAVAVGPTDGDIYVTGITTSTDFLTFLPLIDHNSGGQDIFIAKIDPNATLNRPALNQALISGKNLILFGQGFDLGAVLRINDDPVKTRNGDPDPSQILIAKKALKGIDPGQTIQLQVENPNGKRSNFLFFRKPL
ncbi:MAG TPA: SBBP repeat-containing protein [Blastocatellia bacterium]|nr:SBBP repeat-containing protein [Blastocatellia bacterium]